MKKKKKKKKKTATRFATAASTAGPCIPYAEVVGPPDTGSYPAPSIAAETCLMKEEVIITDLEWDNNQTCSLNLELQDAVLIFKLKESQKFYLKLSLSNDAMAL